MRISIVIPVREGSAYLEEALASLAAQTRPPDEIVLVDALEGDGSARFAGDGVLVVRRRRAGPAAARNEGLAVAGGDLVGFLDADDIAMPRRLELQERILADDPGAAAVIGSMENFLSPDCIHLAGSVRFPRGPQTGWHVGALLARRAAIVRTGPFDETRRHGETVDWLDRFRRRAGTVRVVEDVVLRRRVHETNETRRQPTDLHAGYLAAARAAIERSREAS